jgi:hypothetical protein
MIPEVEQSSWMIIIYWILMFPIAVFVLVRTTDFWADDGPGTLMQAVRATLLTGVVVFLTYDLTGYVFARMMQMPEMGFVFPEGYGYFNWIREPLCLKWQVLGIIPVIRYLPVLFALTAGGTLQVIWWNIPFKQGLVAFISQVVLNVFAMAMLSLVFSFFVGVQAGVAAENAPRRNQRQADARSRDRARANRPQPQNVTQEAPSGLPGLQQRVREIGVRKGPFANRMWERWASVNSIFDPVYALFQPVTRFLPLPVQDFLNGGGWLIAVPGLGGLAWFGWQRRRRSLGLETG